MEIKFRTYYWNNDKTKIIGQRVTTMTEEELCEIVNSQYDSGEIGIPIHLSKDDVIFETIIDEVKH